MEDLRAQIEAIADGQTSFDLWVPDEVTLNGAPLRQDAAMALLVDRLLARGLFPHGFSAGAGGRTYHYRQGPPEVPGGVPPAGKPLRVPRVLEAGKAYQLHVEHRGAGGSNILAADLRATMTSVRPDAVVLDVLAERGTLSQSTQPLFSGVRFQITLPTFPEKAPPAAPPDDSPNRFDFPDPAPDEATQRTISGLFPTFNFERCILPREAHATGEKWTESVPTWFFGDVEIDWSADGVMVDAGGALALYEAVWRIPATKGGPRTFVTHEVSLIVRTADGFIGECEVKDSTLGPDFPTTTTKITSTRD